MLAFQNGSRGCTHYSKKIIIKVVDVMIDQVFANGFFVGILVGAVWATLIYVIFGLLKIGD